MTRRSSGRRTPSDNSELTGSAPSHTRRRERYSTPLGGSRKCGTIVSEIAILVASLPCPDSVAAFPGLPARDVNELGRTFPGGLSFPAPEPNPQPQPFAA